MVVFAVDIGCRMIGFRREEPSNVDDALGLASGATPSAEWLCPRPGRDVSLGSETERDWKSCHPAALTLRSKNSPVFSIACIVTASLRATATAARLKPTLSLSLSPHVRKPLSAEERVSMTVAAS
jgi:hypothetical protein